MSGTVEIRLHLKGHFESTSKVSYIDGCCSIIKDYDPNSLRFHNLKDIYSSAGGGSEPIRFFFGSKSGIETGVHEIKTDLDLQLWVYLYEGSPFLELYAATDEPPECVSSSSNDVDDGNSEAEPSDLGKKGDIADVDDFLDVNELFDGECRIDDEQNIWSGLKNFEDLHVTQETVNVRLDASSGDHQATEFDAENDPRDGDENWVEEITSEDEQLLYSDDKLYPDFRVEEELQQRKFQLAVGQTFTCVQEFRVVLKEWAIREGINFEYVKNESSRVTVVCAEGCSWRLHASPVLGEKTFRIKTLNGEHTCGRQHQNKCCNSRYVAIKYRERIKDNPKMPILAIQNDVKREMKVQISLVQAYKAKRKAIEMNSDDEIKQYQRLWDYCETVKKYNQGSTIRIKLVDIPLQESRDGVPINVTEGRVFQRMYFCLDACKRGFLAGCRPIIGLDGCILTGNYKGQLLSAVARDGNDNMFPIAFCVAEAEIYESWKWFLDNLSDDIGESNGVQWTIISDRQKGLGNAIAEVFPNAQHRYCVRHMYENFKKKHRGKLLMDLFWRAASATNSADFRIAMQMLERADPAKVGYENAASWLENVPREQWSRAFFNVNSKCDIVVNNLNESFNSCILPAREMSIVSMMDWIRRMIMRMICAKREWLKGYSGDVCPNVLKKIEKYKDLANRCFAEHSDGRKFGVDCGDRHYVVDLENKTCTCRRFELTGIPCQHAIAAIQFDRGNVENFVHNAYKREAYMLAYSFSVYPVPSMDFWEETGLGEIHPPFVRKQPGRPKKLRRRGPSEPRPPPTSTRVGVTKRCTLCKQLGHNKRGCQKNPHNAASKSQVNAAPVQTETGQSHQAQPGGVNVRRNKNPVFRRGLAQKNLHSVNESSNNLNEPRAETPGSASASYYAAISEVLSQSNVNSAATSDKGFITPRRSPRNLHQRIEHPVQLPRKSPRSNKSAVSKKLQVDGLLTKSKEKFPK